MKDLNINFPFDKFEKLIIDIGWESLDDWINFWNCQKEILSTNTPSKIRNSLSDKLNVMGKKLHKLQPITVDKLVVKASDKQAIKTAKVQANKILNSHATKGVAWRVDFNQVFEKFVEYLFKKTMNIVGGSIHENRTIYSQNPFNKLSLSHLEPEKIER